MSPEAIREMLARRPFIPFRMHLTDGRNFVITRPELVFLGGAVTVIGIVRNTASEFFDEPVIIANWAIVSLEPILEPAATA
jgi:hypothetical protein